MYFDEFELNAEIEIPAAVIDRKKMLAFAADYDNIPLHTNEEYAKTTHFGDIIAPGVMSFMSVWSKYLEVDLFGEELIAGKSTKIEWFKPVYAEDILSSKGVITGLTPRNEKNGIVEFKISAYNQHGELVLTGLTEAVVKRKPKA